MARVLTEFGWVRELNEGVKRIYSDMSDFYLEPPIYTEPEQSVKLTLKNNIAMRTMRQKDRAKENLGQDIWLALDGLERKIVTYMSGKNTVTRQELCSFCEKSNATVTKRLNHLIELGLINRDGNKYDPNHTYALCIDETKS